MPGARLIEDRFELLEMLGRGGHGVVYSALDRTTNTQVAIKFLRDDVAVDPQYNVRLIREAQAMAALEGTSAVQILKWGATVDGALYLVMEFLRGRDLDDHMVAREAELGRVPVDEVFTLFEPIVTTLEAAHKQGIIHRDLKPANVFVRDAAAGGGVRLLDFGLAKVISAQPLTQDGIVAGSPSYIAPEAWRGNPRALDHRIDVYSLGALIFRALGGRVPFEGADIFEKIKLATTGERPSLRALRPELPPIIDAWVQQSLAINPDNRFQHVRGMWSALSNALGRPSTPPRR